MKLQLSILAACATADTVPKKRVNVPGKPVLEDSGEKFKTGPATIHCENQPGSTHWNDPTTSVSSVAETDTAGMFGSVAITEYVNDLHCYVDFAEQCDEQGVDIEYTHIDIENSMTYYNYTYYGNTTIYEYDPCQYDQIKFGYTDANGDLQYTEYGCGCHNCDKDGSEVLWYPDELEGATKYSLVGTDLKFVLSTDVSVNGGSVAFNWQCRSYGNDICPSKFDGSEESGCYTQSNLWQPGKDVSCSMDNAACLTTTCSADSISSFFRGDLFHVNSKHDGTFMEQLQADIRVLKRKDTGAVLVENDPCGYTVSDNGVNINWNYEKCEVAPSMKNGKIAYGITIQAFGNDADNDSTIEFYVDFDATAECLYDPEIDVEASFFINQEDVEASTDDEGSLLKNFRCLFFEDEAAKNQIKEHNIVNMGERIYGRVRSKNNSGYGLIYKLQRVTFTDASGKITPPPSFHVVGGGSGGMGSTIVKAAVQKSKHVPKKPYWRSLGKNMKFSFLSFGFENLSEQNEVDIKCRIKIDIDPNMFPEAAAAANAEGTRTLIGEPEYNYDDTTEWGSLDYYDEDY
jgi:hypothetical protein